MIKFWYDMATLSWRYMESSPHFNGDMAVVRNDGTIEIVPKHKALDLALYSRVVNEPQDLLDALIQAGFKPNKLEGTPGHVEALRQHISFAERVATTLLARKK